jgi:hypothetical protein
MKIKKKRPAKIAALTADFHEHSLIRTITVCAVNIPHISPFVFRCPLCGEVHTASDPICRNSSHFSLVRDSNGKMRKLHPKWRFLVEISSPRERALAGDIGNWLHDLGCTWKP